MLVRKKFMKNISKAVVLTLMLGSFSAQARGGHRGGNGGNSIASHFSTIARNVEMIWDDICVNEKDPEGYCNYRGDYAGLLQKDSASYVLVKGEKDPNQVKAYDGEIREAINFTDPSNQIIVNEEAWKDMETDPKVYSRRIGLVLHEYLTFIGLDGSDHYDFSSAIFGMLVRKGYDLNKLTRIEGLPSPCSISIEGNTNSDIYERFKVGLIKKGYIVKTSREETRYKVNLSSACADRTATNSCALHAQVDDTYTDSTSFNEMVIDTAVFSKRSKVFKKLSDKILKKFPTRKCTTIVK